MRSLNDPSVQRHLHLILMALAAGAATYFLGRPLLNLADWPGAGLRRLSGR